MLFFFRDAIDIKYLKNVDMRLSKETKQNLITYTQWYDFK